MVEAMENLKSVSDSLSTCYKQLQRACKNFNESTTFGHCETLENSYGTCSNIFVNWATNLERRKDVIKNSIVSLVDFSKKEMQIAASRVDFRNKMGSDYWQIFYQKYSVLF